MQIFFLLNLGTFILHGPIPIGTFGQPPLYFLHARVVLSVPFLLGIEGQQFLGPNYTI